VRVVFWTPFDVFRKGICFWVLAFTSPGAPLNSDKDEGWSDSWKAQYAIGVLDFN
jgi:hypothetical protein